MKCRESPGTPEGLQEPPKAPESRRKPPKTSDEKSTNQKPPTKNRRENLPPVHFMLLEHLELIGDDGGITHLGNALKDARRGPPGRARAGPGRPRRAHAAVARPSAVGAHAKKHPASLQGTIGSCGVDAAATPPRAFKVERRRWPWIVPC